MPSTCVDGNVQLELGTRDGSTMLRERYDTVRGTSLDYTRDSPLQCVLHAAVLKRGAPLLCVCTNGGKLAHALSYYRSWSVAVASQGCVGLFFWRVMM